MYRNWRDLIRPRGVEIDPQSKSPTYGKFVCEPLERGYGYTLGAALRRVLLSSLQGCAITTVRIEGALHEFTNVPDVKEDVTEIILNLKEVRLRNLSPSTEPMTLHIKKAGPATLRAADLEVNSQIQVLNPNFHIASIGEGGSLEMELCVEQGKGYLRADTIAERAEMPIGTIPIDAIFSPISKVNYTVTNARVGQHTDYDKLTLEVWTDGSVSPEDAIAFAAKILKEQLSIFINFDESQEPEESSSDEVHSELNEVLNRPVADLELSVRSANCLQNANIRFIGELVQRTEAEMLKTKNFGRKSLREIKEIMTQMGLNLGMKLDGWRPPEEKA
jgi:DNA-directed RNA polymerase subunit alpha